MVGLFVFYFRDLFFRSAFKYTIEEDGHPHKEKVLTFIKYPKHKASEKFSLRRWWTDKFFKCKIVLVAGETSPIVYNKDFNDSVKVAKRAGIEINMIAGPTFLTNSKGESYALMAAEDGLINLYVAKHRLRIHFRANLFTGELFYEYPHEPNATNRTSVHFKENRFEVKQYLREANKLIKQSKPFNMCKIEEDYIMVKEERLEQIKKCIEIHGTKEFDKCTVQDIKDITAKCPEMV